MGDEEVIRGHDLNHLNLYTHIQHQWYIHASVLLRDVRIGPVHDAQARNHRIVLKFNSCTDACKQLEGILDTQLTLAQISVAEIARTDTNLKIWIHPFLWREIVTQYRRKRKYHQSIIGICRRF